MRVADTIAAARGTGCHVVEVLDDAGVPRVELECASGWAAARYLLELARGDARDPDIVRLARRMRQLAPRDRDFAGCVHAFVQKYIRFARERGEIFQAAPITLRRAVGDCDCHARLVFALLLAGGLRPRLAFLHRDGGPIHVLVQVHHAGAWVWLETTVKGARFGEHPVAAARRLGVIRSDVGGEMKEAFMGPIGVEGGNVYRMRIGGLAPRDGVDVGEAIAATLRALGFVDVTIWLEAGELPADFAPHAREELEGAEWTAWAEALYAQPMCRMIEMPLQIPAAREGLLAITIDDLHVVASPASSAPIKVAYVTAPSGVKLRAEPHEQATVRDLVPFGARVVVLEEGLAATRAAPKGWTKVRAGALEGFVSSEWLADAPASSGTTIGELGDPIVRYTADLSPAFFAKLKAAARRVNVDPEHAMAVMLSESGLRASAIHPSAPASGIFGRMFKTRGEAEAFRNQPADVQVDAWEAFMRPYKALHLNTPEAIYQVNFLPASAMPSSPHFRGTHLAAVLAASDGTGYGGQEAGFYRDNVVLDVDRDGKITNADMRATIERNKRANANRWNEAAARLAAAPEPDEGVGDVTLAVIPWLALVGFVWYMFRS
jgi:hypothetical protein